MPQPQLGGINPVPVRALVCFQEEVDGSGAGAFTRRCVGSPGFPEPSALRMRREFETGDDLPRHFLTGAHEFRPVSRIMAAPFSAIIIVGALVLPEVIVVMPEASTTRQGSIPFLRSRWSKKPTENPL